jgi:hypothetical protein
MSSFFKNWTAHDIVGPLNKAEIKAVLLDHGFERIRFRTWDSIEELILTSSDEVKKIVYESAVAKKKIEDQHQMEVRKRRLEDQKFERKVRQKLSEFFLMIYGN